MIGIVALIGALPLFEPLRQMVPITLLRSPARLIYLSTFSLAAALGVGIDRLLRWKPLGWVVAIVCLAFHAWDLGSTSRFFVTPGPLHPLDVPEFSMELGTGRVAVSRILDLQAQHTITTTPEGFDAIFLADTYRKLLALTGAPARSNEEVMDASTWPPHALQAAGVQFVIPWGARKDLELVKSAAGLQMYRVRKSGATRLCSSRARSHRSSKFARAPRRRPCFRSLRSGLDRRC